MSFTQFTLEDANSMTVGTTNNLSVGEANSAFCTGQTVLTATTNNSVTLGTYLAAVLGNNVTWTYGATLGMQDGATMNFSDSSTTQAEGSVILKGGIHPVALPVLASLKAAMTATKVLIGATVGINLAYGATLGILDAKSVSSDDVAQQVTETTLIGVSNAALAAALILVVRSLAAMCQTMPQTSTLTLGQTGVALEADFQPACDSAYTMSPVQTKMWRTSPVGQSSISFTDADTVFKRVTAAVTSLELGDAESQFSFTTPGAASSLLLAPDSAKLQGGASSLLVTPAAMTAEVGASSVAITPDDFLVESAGCTLNMAQELFVASTPGAMLLLSPEAIEADSVLIKLA